MHMLSKKDQNEMEFLRRCGNTIVVLTANGEVHTNEKAQVYVHDLNLFVRMQLLGETLAVPSRGKLFEEHGCSSEWVSGQKPRLTKEGKDNCMQNGQLRTSCCPWVVHQFWEQSVVSIHIAGFVFNKSSSRAK